LNQAERAYYERRAQEYDDFYLGTGLYAARERPGWHEEVEALERMLRSLCFGTILDVACGTGFLTRHFQARVVALDQSASMLRIASTRLPGSLVVRGDALQLPFPASAFECLSACHLYGHLRMPERERFLGEARRVARELLIVDAGLHSVGCVSEEVQQRMLNDGSRHSVYKRYFTPEQLAAELGGGTVLHAGRWFVAVLA
jgi:demethylmenaquinone methyltransferase/2-methoxy-6-polyprenyl-1,4-benzoquinol methylase